MSLDRHQRLKKEISAFPDLPGVYLMKDAEGQVIYVGKARALRARVRTYFAGGDGRLQIEALISRIETIEKIVTANEQQAFLLERDLITRYKPRYNIRLKDDKAYLSIRVDLNAEWPRLDLVRKISDDGARYFGPYSFSYELRTLLDIIKRVVPLRTCTDTVFYNRQRPCLEYQIKRCSGPCCLAVDPQQYREWVKQAISILEGKTETLERDLAKQMERASDDLRFEDAALIRDRLDILQNFKKGQELLSYNGENRDVLGLYREEGLAALVIVRVRFGRIADTANFTLQDVAISDQEIIESALSQYYQGGREIPSELLVPMDFENRSVIAESLSAAADRSIEIIIPQRGVKARLLDLAQLNAREHFVARFDAETRAMDLAKAVAKMFSLRQVPRRIECIDISNLQGSDIVGALVTFFDGAPDKSRYRKYRITQQGKPDDFASIHEVVRRRLERGKAEEGLPDLLIIDGGAGQLREALRARDELGVTLDIIAIAKLRTARDAHATELLTTPERIYLSPDAEPIPLAPESEVTKFFQRIRDETHRFVITFHRTTRAKRVFRSAIDGIAGIGPERRGRLFRAYGSVDRMKSAPPEELAKAGRMPKSLAEKLIRVLSES